MNERAVKIWHFIIVVLFGPVILSILIAKNYLLYVPIPFVIMLLFGIYVIVRLPRARIDLLLRLVYEKIKATDKEEEEEKQALRCAFLKPMLFSNIRKSIVKIYSYNFEEGFNYTKRKIRLGVGTAGRAYGSGKEIIMPSLDDENGTAMNFEDAMIQKWGFSKKECRKLRNDRKSICQHTVFGR